MRVPAYGEGKSVGSAVRSSEESSESVQEVHVYICRCCEGRRASGENSSRLGFKVSYIYNGEATKTRVWNTRANANGSNLIC